jgi:hypothetical protein
MALPGLPGMPGRESIAVGPPASNAPSNCTNGPCGIVYAMIGATDSTIARFAAQYLGFYMSIDGGATWTAEQVPSATLPNGNGSVTLDGTSANNSTQAPFDQALAVSPTNPNDVYFGGVGLYESTANGALGTWIFLPTKNLHGETTHTDQHALAFEPAPNSSTLLIGNDGGLYTWNATSGFAEKNDSINAGQIQSVGIHPSNANHAIVGFQDNGTQTDAGILSWSVTDTGDGGWTRYSFGNPAYAYHTYTNEPSPSQPTPVPFVAYSSDHGNTWNTTHPPAAFFQNEGTTGYPPLAVTSDSVSPRRTFLAARHIYALGFSNGNPVWAQQETTDLTGGCTTTGCAIEDVEFSPVDPAVAWTISTTGGMPEPTTGQTFRVFETNSATLNSGAVWTDVTGDLPAGTIPTGITLDPFHHFYAYVTAFAPVDQTAGNQTIYKTTSGAGTTHWTPLSGPTLNGHLLSVLSLIVDASDPTDNSLLAGTDAGLYRSLDGGQTWSNFDMGIVPAIPVFDIAQNLQYEILVGTHGAGAYRLPPPVIFRGTGAVSESCETGTGCNVTVNDPTTAKNGDTIVAFVFAGFCHAVGDLQLTSPWQLISGTNFDTTYNAGCSTDGSSGWVITRPVNYLTPLPSGGVEGFNIANSCITFQGGETCIKAAGATIAYSGATGATLYGFDSAKKGSQGTSFTAPGFNFGQHDGVAVQWFFDDSLDANSETYEDTYGFFVAWTPPSDPTLLVRKRGAVPAPTSQMLTEVPLPSAKTYGSWTANAYSAVPADGDPTPPPATGDGVAWTVRIPPGN